MTKTVSFLSDKAPPRNKIELTLDQKREICLFYVENSKCGNKFKKKDSIVKFNQNNAKAWMTGSIFQDLLLSKLKEALLEQLNNFFPTLK
ncbi:hypothetical protein BpHYR1_030405 [Brachionus plicatilis]|uniref:Uncharacterized protein n=1 Tax=Brachionus plicatilis TaxID=10195 RepID=A0A3M7T281_BRAPC|nr:hypothetical protein BpHYR1_030405 [Brachionus plicatilis]